MNKTTNGNTVTFHPTVRTYQMPKIMEEMIGDDGELHYILDNGNTSLASRYNSLWLPTKGVVNMAAKAPNPDTTKSHYK
ncbi:MAG: hypothetical protein V4538_15360 [Bacteroidota bacterium]